MNESLFVQNLTIITHLKQFKLSTYHSSCPDLLSSRQQLRSHECWSCRSQLSLPRLAESIAIRWPGRTRHRSYVRPPFLALASSARFELELYEQKAAVNEVVERMPILMGRQAILLHHLAEHLNMHCIWQRYFNIMGTAQVFYLDCIV